MQVCIPRSTDLYSQEHIPRNICKPTVALTGYLSSLFLWGILLFSHPMAPFSSVLFLIPGVESKKCSSKEPHQQVAFLINRILWGAIKCWGSLGEDGLEGFTACSSLIWRQDRDSLYFSIPSSILLPCHSHPGVVRSWAELPVHPSPTHCLPQPLLNCFPGLFARLGNPILEERVPDFRRRAWADLYHGCFS